jgi:hypothetical protein
VLIRRCLVKASQPCNWQLAVQHGHSKATACCLVLLGLLFATLEPAIQLCRCHCRLTTVTHTLPSHSRQPTQMLPQLHQRELPACRARQRQELCSGRQLL